MSDSIHIKQSLHALPVYSVEEIRHYETKAIQSGTPETELMQKAGHALFEFIQTHYNTVDTLLIFAGKGNNGGDGHVLAKLAEEHGFTVHINTIPKRLSPNTLIIDALIGIGLKRDVRDPYRALIQTINTLPYPVLAVDCPSGLNCDTGTAGANTVKANHTLTFIGLKKGLFLQQACDYTGQIHLNTLNLDTPASTLNTLSYSEETTQLPDIAASSHKGSMGHTVIIAGNTGMAGAGILAAEAALSTGVGYVTLITHPAHVIAINTRSPEIMTGDIHDDEQLIQLINKATAIVIGPGLGVSDRTKYLLETVLASKKRTVIDADALNCIAKHNISLSHQEIILTPHPGEASRLLSLPTQEIQEDRLDSITKLYKTYNTPIFLKGAPSLLKLKDSTIEINPYGHAGMAKGGFGDVLSGLLGGFLAQPLSFELAVNVGIVIHGHSAEQSPIHPRSLKASDILKRFQDTSVQRCHLKYF